MNCDNPEVEHPGFPCNHPDTDLPIEECQHEWYLAGPRTNEWLCCYCFTPKPS